MTPREMSNIQYFWWLTKQGLGHLWFERCASSYITTVLFIAALATAIAQRAYTDVGSLWVCALFATPVFALIVGTLGARDHTAPQIRSSSDTEQDGTWHQTIVSDKDDLNSERDGTWYRTIIHSIDPRGRSVPESLLKAALLAHIVALIVLFYALPNISFFIVSVWAFTTWHLLWTLFVSAMSISGAWM